MDVHKLRIDLRRALAENRGARTLDEICDFVDAPGRAIGPGEVKAALDGLVEADQVVWEARGEATWRLSPQGQDAAARDAAN